MKNDTIVINLGLGGTVGDSPKFICHLPARFVKEEFSESGKITLIGRTFTGIAGELDGNYVLIRETKNEAFEIDRDMFGSIPLFYSLKTGVVSTDIRDLLTETGINWSPEGVSEYISCAFNSLGRTIYKYISVLRPDESLHVSDGVLSIRRKKNYYVQPPIDGDLDELIKAAFERSIGNLADEVGDQCILNLSGGNDSTLILAMLRGIRPNLKVYSNTFFHTDWRDDFDDWRYAKRAAEKYNTDHKLVNIKNSTFEHAHRQLVKSGRNVFHTYATAFYMQNIALDGMVQEGAPIVNGSGPDETMIGTEKISVGELISMNKLSRQEWINYSDQAKDYLKVSESKSAKLLKMHSEGFMGHRHKLALELSQDSGSFVEFQRRFHSMLILQDHICELSQVAAVVGRPIFFPLLTNDIFRIVFGSTFQELNRNGVYKAIVKNMLLDYMDPPYVNRTKVGFQSPSRKYFMSPDGFGQEIHRLLRRDYSSILSMDEVREAVLERLSEDFSISRRYDFVEWAVFNLLRLEELNE